MAWNGLSVTWEISGCLYWCSMVSRIKWFLSQDQGELKKQLRFHLISSPFREIVRKAQSRDKRLVMIPVCLINVDFG